MSSGSNSKGGTGILPVSSGKRKWGRPITGFQETRRNLPHMQEPGRTYFVTYRLREGQLPEPARRIALDACLYWNGRKCHIHACVVMPDHVHLLLTPLATGRDQCYHSLSEILHSIKSFSALEINRLLGRQGPLWLDENFDRIVRSQDEFREKWEYIRENPVSKGLVAAPEDYPFLYEDC